MHRGPGLAELVQSAGAVTCPNAASVMDDVQVQVWKSAKPIPQGLRIGGAGWSIDERQALRLSGMDVPCEDDRKIPWSCDCKFLAQIRGHSAVARIEAGGAGQCSRWLPAERNDANLSAFGNFSSDPVKQLKHGARGSSILCRTAPEGTRKQGLIGISGM